MGSGPAVWYYQRETFFNPVEEGPFSEQQLKELARSGKLKLTTLVRSPVNTKNRWVEAKQFASLGVLINQAKMEADQRALVVKEEKAAAKAEKRELALNEKKARKVSEISLQHQREMNRIELEKQQSQASMEKQPQPQVVINNTVVAGASSGLTYGAAAIFFAVLSWLFACVPVAGGVLAMFAIVLGVFGVGSVLLGYRDSLILSIAGLIIPVLPLLISGGVLGAMFFSVDDSSQFTYDSSDQLPIDAAARKDAVSESASEPAGALDVSDVKEEVVEGDADPEPSAGDPVQSSVQNDQSQGNQQSDPIVKADDPGFETIDTVGDVKVEITSVSIGKVETASEYFELAENDDYLILKLRVSNLSSTRKLRFRGFSNGFGIGRDTYATDSFDNRYSRSGFPSSVDVVGLNTGESLYPGKSADDLVAFEVPIDAAEEVFVTLDAGVVDEDGVFKFLVDVRSLR